MFGCRHGATMATMMVDECCYIFLGLPACSIAPIEGARQKGWCFRAFRAIAGVETEMIGRFSALIISCACARFIVFQYCS
jgi:hypothetical protein